MPYSATAIEVMIASPSDVPAERGIVREVLAEWNAVHSRDRQTVLMPIGWETHSAPDLGGRPQQIINEKLLATADVLVGIFWTKVGSPTGKAISGSVEEIQEHRAQGKPVMLYFSSQPAALDTVDPEQYQSLKEFKEWAMKEGLVSFFESPEDFRNRFRRDLQIHLRDNQYLVSRIGPDAVEEPQNAGISLSDNAKSMLLAAASNERQPLIMIRRTLGGTPITAGSTSFGDPQNRRSVAEWAAVVDELYDLGLVHDINGKHEIFELTDAGYRMSDRIKGETSAS